MADPIDNINESDLESGLTDEYKAMIDEMLVEEADGTAKYVSYEMVKAKFLPKPKC